MRIKKLKPKESNQDHKRIQEIGKILLNAINRLEVKEKEQNPQIPLDNKPLRSVDSVGLKTNQQFINL